MIIAVVVVGILSGIAGTLSVLTTGGGIVAAVLGYLIGSWIGGLALVLGLLLREMIFQRERYAMDRTNHERLFPRRPGVDVDLNRG